MGSGGVNVWNWRDKGIVGVEVEAEKKDKVVLVTKETIEIIMKDNNKFNNTKPDSNKANPN